MEKKSPRRSSSPPAGRRLSPRSGTPSPPPGYDEHAAFEAAIQASLHDAAPASAPPPVASGSTSGFRSLSYPVPSPASYSPPPRGRSGSPSPPRSRSPSPPRSRSPSPEPAAYDEEAALATALAESRLEADPDASPRPPSPAAPQLSAEERERAEMRAKTLALAAAMRRDEPGIRSDRPRRGPAGPSPAAAGAAGGPWAAQNAERLRKEMDRGYNPSEAVKRSILAGTEKYKGRMGHGTTGGGRSGVSTHQHGFEVSGGATNRKAQQVAKDERRNWRADTQQETRDLRRQARKDAEETEEERKRRAQEYRKGKK
jgi:hypothetical protein